MTFENDLIFSITQFANSFRTALDKSLREIGLYSGQVYILILLWKNDGQTQVSLAQKLNLSPPTIHKMIKSLSENDFVNARRCGEDARRMIIKLTEKGTKIRPLVERQWSQVETKVLAPLTETEKLIFRQILDKLRENLNCGG